MLFHNTEGEKPLKYLKISNLLNKSCYFIITDHISKLIWNDKELCSQYMYLVRFALFWIYGRVIKIVEKSVLDYGNNSLTNPVPTVCPDCAKVHTTWRTHTTQEYAYHMLFTCSSQLVCFMLGGTRTRDGKANSTQHEEQALFWKLTGTNNARSGARQHRQKWCLTWGRLHCSHCAHSRCVHALTSVENFGTHVPRST